MKYYKVNSPAEIIRQTQRTAKKQRPLAIRVDGDVDDYIFRGENQKHCSER